MAQSHRKLSGSHEKILAALPLQPADPKEIKLEMRPFTTLHPFVDLKDVDEKGNLQVGNLKEVKELAERWGQSLKDVKEEGSTLAARDRAGFIERYWFDGDYDVVYHGQRIGHLYKEFADGQYSSVWLVNDGASWFALKDIHRHASFDRLMSEFEIAKQAGMATFLVYEDNQVMMGMPLISGGNWHELMVQVALPTVQITGYIASAFQEMERIHDKFNVAHRDIKPANLLIEKFNTLRLTDFGFAVRLDEHAKFAPTFLMGTPGYIAPEFVNTYSQPVKAALDGKKVDLFALGVSAAQMCYRWPHLVSNMSDTFKIGKQQVSDAKLDTCTIPEANIRTRIVKLFQDMTRPSPDERKPLTECKKEMSELHEEAKQSAIVKVIIDVAEILTLEEEDLHSLCRASRLADIVLLVQSRELNMVERTEVIRRLNPFEIVFDREDGCYRVSYNKLQIMNIREEIFSSQSSTDNVTDVVAAIPSFESTTPHDCSAYYVFLTAKPQKTSVLANGQVVVMKPLDVLPGREESVSALKERGLFMSALKKMKDIKLHEVKKADVQSVVVKR